MNKRSMRTPQAFRREAELLVGEELLMLPPTKSVSEKEKIRRAAQMSLLYHDSGWSLEDVGMAYGLTRERIRQIFEGFGMVTREAIGGQRIRRRG